jgi:ribose 5-phosphate isomerase
MVVGLGTGSTAYFAVERVGQKLKSGELKDIVCIPTSERTREQVQSIPAASFAFFPCHGAHSLNLAPFHNSHAHPPSTSDVPGNSHNPAIHTSLAISATSTTNFLIGTACLLRSNLPIVPRVSTPRKQLYFFKKALGLFPLQTNHTADERAGSQAESLDIPLCTLNEKSTLDVAIDGADAVDPDFALVKGGGGALLREKMVEVMAKKFICIVDDSKLCKGLGPSFALPVEIVPFCSEHTLRTIAALPELAGGSAVIRTGDCSNNKVPLIPCPFAKRKLESGWSSRWSDFPVWGCLV